MVHLMPHSTAHVHEHVHAHVISGTDRFFLYCHSGAHSIAYEHAAAREGQGSERGGATDRPR